MVIAHREKLDIFPLTISARFDRLDFETQNILTALAGSNENFSSNLKNHTQKLQDGISAEFTEQTKAISQMMSRLEPIFAVPEDIYKKWASGQVSMTLATDMFWTLHPNLQPLKQLKSS
jgi:hypothetical protein